MNKRRDVFQAIADPTRREILKLVTEKPLTLNAIAENFKSSRPTISLHVKLLQECELVALEKRGRERYCTLKPAALREVSEWADYFRKFWDNKLDDLEDYLDQLSDE